MSAGGQCGVEVECVNICKWAEQPTQAVPVAHLCTVRVL